LSRYPLTTISGYVTLCRGSSHTQLANAVSALAMKQSEKSVTSDPYMTIPKSKPVEKPAKEVMLQLEGAKHTQNLTQPIAVTPIWTRAKIGKAA